VLAQRRPLAELASQPAEQAHLRGFHVDTVPRGSFRQLPSTCAVGTCA
jgi:hypothetical protein